MQYNLTYTQNLAALKRCEKIYKWVFIFYAAFCVPHIIGAIIFIVITPSHNEIDYLLNGIVFKLILLCLGTMGCYKKNQLLAAAAPVCAAVNLLLYQGLNSMIMTLSIPAAILTIMTNRKYKYLEQCEGFPYFNERFESSEELRNSGRNIYQERYEEIKEKHTSDKMDEI